jgi:hypothetical protein
LGQGKEPRFICKSFNGFSSKGNRREDVGLVLQSFRGFSKKPTQAGMAVQEVEGQGPFCKSFRAGDLAKTVKNESGVQ